MEGQRKGWRDRDSGRMVDSGKKGQEGQRDIGMYVWMYGGMGKE